MREAAPRPEKEDRNEFPVTAGNEGVAVEEERHTNYPGRSWEAGPPQRDRKKEEPF